MRPGAILEFDELGAIPVADVVADPGRFEGETLADPIERIGQNCRFENAKGSGSAAQFPSAIAATQ